MLRFSSTPPCNSVRLHIVGRSALCNPDPATPHHCLHVRPILLSQLRAQNLVWILRKSYREPSHCREREREHHGSHVSCAGSSVLHICASCISFGAGGICLVLFGYHLSISLLESHRWVALVTQTDDIHQTSLKNQYQQYFTSMISIVCLLHSAHKMYQAEVSFLYQEEARRKNRSVPWHREAFSFYMIRQRKGMMARA